MDVARDNVEAALANNRQLSLTALKKVNARSTSIHKWRGAFPEVIFYS